MNPHVARGAVLISWLGQVVGGGCTDHAVVADAKGSGAVVAFETHGKDGGARQHPGIRRTVGHVAGLAPVDAHGSVFVDEGSALVGVAFEASFLIAFLLIDHVRSPCHPPGCGESAVRIVAVSALDGTFIDPMFEGHRELRLYSGVAGIAELILLLLREEKSRRFRVVDGMAIGAHDIGLSVSAPPDVGARKGLGVAAEAGGQCFLGPDFGERDDGRLASVSLDMGLAGPVATFAPCIFRRLLAARQTLVMRVAKELIPNGGVTGLAGVAANEIGAFRNNRQE